jgi:hypothetical protein
MLFFLFFKFCIIILIFSILGFEIINHYLNQFLFEE